MEARITKVFLGVVYLGDAHKLRNKFGGRGLRFVTSPFKSMGICRVFCSEGGGGLKIRKNFLGNLWMFPQFFIHLKLAKGLNFASIDSSGPLSSLGTSVVQWKRKHHRLNVWTLWVLSSIPVNVKTVQMLCEVFFALLERQL